ncbi:MAG: site-specific DNA-methyltransferase [Caldilineaceae bacterium]|nr:site-specific DNA-methyltransferase [Caldilineaceae bacterium]MDE0337687.1 site-specific DNA-methyltransferase [Caldilineaceae bacterium]
MLKRFHDKLTDLLKADARFVGEDGELVVAAIIDRAWKIDHDLVRLLLADADVKAKFFDEIDGHWVFSINTFIDYISDKNFLDNSYTRFRNRIGLNIDGKFLRERGEVSLVWPYKDCVLEGGQTRDEDKRNEVFFNEILAQDEIDCLFGPKVLTGWKRFTVDGEKEVRELRRDKDGTIRENLIIRGNNLLALHTLKQQFRGKVKLIYIDPPYNTGNDSFGYNDRFNHSSWLTFMKNRLDAARELLREDGVLLVQCDDNEQAYVKVLLDEVFERENFIATIVWQKKYGPSNDARIISDTHEYVVCFAKAIDSCTFSLTPRNQKQLSAFKNPDNDHRGVWRASDLSARTFSEKTYYAIETPTGKVVYPPESRSWTISQERYEALLADNRIWFGISGEGRPMQKKFLSEVRDGITPQTWWDRDFASDNKIARYEIKEVVENSNFNTLKPERLMQRIVQLTTQPDEIVVDFHLGSGTTCAVAHKMGRQYIGVEQMNYVETITLERLKKVVGSNMGDGTIAFDTGGISESVNWQGGGEFIYCELMQYNQTYMDRIQIAQSSEELVVLWQEIAANSFLNWYVNPETPDDAVDDFNAIGQSENGMYKQRRLLAELLNKNQLYVNLSEIEDEDFAVSKADKTLNDQFYGES